jgi:hypothetical protein
MYCVVECFALGRNRLSQWLSIFFQRLQLPVVLAAFAGKQHAPTQRLRTVAIRSASGPFLPWLRDRSDAIDPKRPFNSGTLDTLFHLEDHESTAS